MNRSYERVNTPEFPLREAYPYIIEHNLLNEAELIKNMKIDWEERETRIKRGRMIEVLKKNGLFNEFIDRVWIRGRTPEGQKKIKECIDSWSHYKDGSWKEIQKKLKRKRR